MACRLGSRHFKGLLMNHELSLSVTAKSHTREPDETHNRADAQGTEPNLVVGLITTANFGISNYNLAILYDVNAVTASAPELIPGNTDQESTGDLNGAKDHVGEGKKRGVICENSPNISHARTAIDHFNAYRMLHPGVCHQNKVCGYPRTENRHEEA